MADREEWCPRCHRATSWTKRGWVCLDCQVADSALRNYWRNPEAQQRLEREREWQARERSAA